MAGRGGRSAKQKGSRNERWLVKLLIEAGFKASRTPLSGAIRALPQYGGGADIEVEMFNRKHRIEAKHHADGFARLYKWLEGVDFVIVRADRSEPLVVMPLTKLLEIATTAKQIGKEESIPASTLVAAVKGHIRRRKKGIE